MVGFGLPRLAIIDQFVSAGGVERFLHGLIRGLLEIPAFSRWEVVVVLAPRNSAGYRTQWPEELRAPNLKYTYMYDAFIPSILYKLATANRIGGLYGTAMLQRAIPNMLKRHGPPSLRRLCDHRLWIEHYCMRQYFDLVYFSYPYFMDYPRLTMPMVATPHDFNYWRFRDSKPQAFAQVSHQMTGWLSACRVLVVSSNFIEDELGSLYPDFEHKARVIRLGIPMGGAVTPTDVEHLRKRLRLPDRFLLTSGWIVPHKNQKVLVEAMGHLLQKGIKLPLVFTGPNSSELQPANRHRAVGYIKELLQACDALGMRYGVDYWGLGYVTDFELECLYRLATALVMPTLYEAGSFPVREAMRAGCPVICSQIPALIEEVGLVGNNAWMFDPSDPEELAQTIEQVLSHPEMTRERAERAAQLVTQVFSWRRTAEGYLSVFEELVR